MLFRITALVALSFLIAPAVSFDATDALADV